MYPLRVLQEAPLIKKAFKSKAKDVINAMSPGQRTKLVSSENYKDDIKELVKNTIKFNNTHNKQRGKMVLSSIKVDGVVYKIVMDDHTPALLVLNGKQLVLKWLD